MGGQSAETGSIVKAVVLDVAKMERLVELSLKPDFVNRLEPGTSSIKSQKKVISILVNLLPYSNNLYINQIRELNI